MLQSGPNIQCNSVFTFHSVLYVQISHSTGAIIDHWGKYFDKSEDDIDLARPRVDYPMNTFDIRTTVIPFGTFLRAVEESDEVLN